MKVEWLLGLLMAAALTNVGVVSWVTMARLGLTGVGVFLGTCAMGAVMVGIGCWWAHK